MSGPDLTRLLAAVDQLHRVVDDLTAPLEAAHRERLRCGRGCRACCVDDLSVSGLEAELLRQRHPALLAGGTPHPEGACALLDEDGACRVYADRPYVCRTQGLPLRWVEDNGVERRDICPLNEPGPSITALPAASCWTLGPFEQRLAAWSEAAGLPRVRLRDLFTSPHP